MFTGIITDIGRVLSVEMRGDTRFTIGTSYDSDGIALGASIACGGACLTVIETGVSAGGGLPHWFAVDVSAETLSKTTLGSWVEGTEVNLERALAFGDELGGHLVTGHVDGLAHLISVHPEGDSHRIMIEVPEGLEGYVAQKGSICLDGVSLTVNEVEDRRFGVNLIPHTWDNTTFRNRVEGDVLNMEVDLLARYVARLMTTSAVHGGK
ncbi:MAG: riboflavin synthase [Alphaproteobacteria bacterium]|nr:riboflavin synthase [Alphaproteobacteria bacterium]